MTIKNDICKKTTAQPLLCKNESIELRIATTYDAPAILEIYAPYIRDTAITFEYVVPSVEEFAVRISSTLANYPFIVAKQKGRVIAYAYAGVFKTRAAYCHSVESSIYVKQSAKQQGVGSILYAALESILLAQNVFSINACIAVPVGENDPYLTTGSVLFHENQGYKQAGRFHGCAYKFNRWYDIVWMQKLQHGHIERLEKCMYDESDETTNTVPSFIPFSELDAEIVDKILEECARC